MNARLLYLENLVQGATAVQMVILLYEQAIRDLRQALAFHRQGNIEARTRELNHALLVIGYLEATLDKVQGGQVAANLERFYRQLRSGLMEAQCQQSGEAIERQITMLVTVRDAWCQVEHAAGAPAAGAAPVAERMNSTRSREGWNA